MKPPHRAPEDSGESLLAHVAQQLAPSFLGERRPHFVVALSGGLDSMVLLNVMAQLRSRLNFSLAALHINHEIHPDAIHWEDACRDQCQLLSIPFEAEHATLELHAGSLEMKAREARYALFGRALKAGDWLLQAHHLNDQAETILFRLLRGQGTAGLAGIPRQRPLGAATLLRPLLSVGREALLDVAKAWQLCWVEDPSNDCLAHDRNFLRHAIFPLLRERFPSVLERIAQSGEWMRQSLDVLQDWESSWLDSRMSVVRGQHCLALDDLIGLEDVPRRSLLKAWLERLGFGTGESLLIEASRQCFQSGAESSPELLLRGAVLRRYRNCLYAIPESHYSLATQDWPASGWSWEGSEPLHLRDGRCLRLPSHIPVQDGPFSVRRRQGGERLDAPGDAHRRDLKIVFQRLGIPPWERDCIPLLFQGDRLIALILDYS